MSKVTVFGTGSFGTALANVLAENGHQVLMWGKNEQTINEINKQHINSKYLKTAKINDSIKATLDIKAAINFSEVFLMALPTKAIRTVASEIDSLLSTPKTFIHVAKGIENDTYKRVSEMLEDSISAEHNAALSQTLSTPVTCSTKSECEIVPFTFDNCSDEKICICF